MAQWLKKRTGEVHPTSRPSVTKSKSSIGSMTQSQLNVAIMEMLELKQDWNKCEAVCRGNPITDAGKRKQIFKMLSLVLIPLMVLSGMTANSFIYSISSYNNAENIRETLFFSTEIGGLLRVLQRERDMSALYVSSIGPDTKDFLLKRYPETDESLQNLSRWPVSDNQPRSEFQTKEKFVGHINRHRYQLDIQNRTAKDEIAFYTDAIEVFIKWLFEAIAEAKSGSVWRSLVAYQEIIVASEYLGRERGIGVTFYAKGMFTSREDYLLFAKSQDVANSSYRYARRYSPLIKDTYDEQLSDDPNLLRDIRNMRNQIRSNNSSNFNPSLVMAEFWFENMTKYQEIIRNSQKLVAANVDTFLSIQADRDLRNIILIAGIFSGIIVLSPVIIFAVYSLTSQTQKYSISIANRTKALNKEKKRTETLLHQMLPESVAERLKRNQQVDAETFSECTIFFSDIVGFTQISSVSSPLQVVDMLNSLYSSFDESIARFDVYKVETIGDAYMVVSGVPRRNGSRHGSEIAAMATDLLDQINRLEIPHLPGTKFKLRIGCHSGNVVAGVVGSKMPRYCLFGETVSVAAKMEALGRANKVHISESTYDLLLGNNNFIIEENRDTYVKDSILFSK
ncbi:hypothetical protein KUTeg_002148, partial [Tegillarca granosa]